MSVQQYQKRVYPEGSYPAMLFAVGFIINFVVGGVTGVLLAILPYVSIVVVSPDL